MQYRFLNAIEETILKRAYSIWGIFELYDKEKLIVSSIITTHPKKEGLQIDKLTIQNRFSLSHTMDVSNNYVGSKANVTESTIRKVFLWSKPLECSDLLLQLGPVSMGIQIGTIKKKKFLPGLNFAELVLNHHRNNSLEFPHIIVNEKAANLVCYGRDIMGGSIISCYNKIKDNQVLIILNEKKEVLGLGRSRFSSLLLTSPNVITVDTVEDIGTFYLQTENKELEGK
ncbi:MAG TPA: PUA domain-containing protein [Candidatus Nitrosocosmicus sp.]|nr:PUA domain-containing protein [Candidatus Nitrosocosmicus sp.]